MNDGLLIEIIHGGHDAIPEFFFGCGAGGFEPPYGGIKIRSSLSRLTSSRRRLRATACRSSPRPGWSATTECGCRAQLPFSSGRRRSAPRRRQPCCAMCGEPHVACSMRDRVRAESERRRSRHQVSGAKGQGCLETLAHKLGFAGRGPHGELVDGAAAALVEIKMNPRLYDAVRRALKEV